MSLLTIVQNAADLCGIPRPSIVAGATDTTVRRLYALAKIEGKSLCQRHRWSALITEATHTTLAAESQGLLETIAPGFSWMVGGTIWNRTQQDHLGGSLTPQEWQEDKAQLSTGPYSRFRIKNKRLYLYPAPAAGQTIAFEYGSRYWCESSGGTDQDTWAADTDVGLLDEHLMTLGLRWRYLQINGLDYGEAFRSYEVEVANAIGRDASPPSVNIADERMIPRGIRVPDGSWSP